MLGLALFFGVGLAKCFWFVMAVGCLGQSILFLCERLEVMWLPMMVIVLFWVLCCLRTV